jgi:hypothetical protein
MTLAASNPRLEIKFAPMAISGVEADGLFEGYASVFGEADMTADVVVPGAFRASLAERGPRGVRMLFQHDPKEVVGVWLDLGEDAKGLRVRGRLLPAIRRASELLTLLREKALDGLSIGFRTVEGRTDPATGHRSLHRIDLWEISLVTFPMLPTARVAGVKHRPPSEREFERMLTRDAGLTRSQAKAVISRGYRAATTGRDAGGPAIADHRLVASLKRAAGLLNT